jgi:putative ABC transport system permease protein
MFILTNAFKSITRAKGRNVLIGIIVFAIAAASCVALAIRNAAQAAQAAGLDSLNITGEITIDRQKLMEFAQSDSVGNRPDMREMMNLSRGLDLPESLKYAESDYVVDFYCSSAITLNGSGGLQAVGSDETPDMGGSGGGIIFGGGGRGSSVGDFSVTGYSCEQAMEKFMSGTAQITYGEMFDFNSNNQCLISSELAMFNGLNIGDTITLTNPNNPDSENESYTFTIVGIYTDSTPVNNEIAAFLTSFDPANLICISYSAFEEIIAANAAAATVIDSGHTGLEISGGMEMTTEFIPQLSFTYVFDSPEKFELFGEELTARGLSEFHVLSSANYDNYESSLIPLENLSEFAAMLLMIVHAIGAVILIVINLFNIRERKYEVGVLTAIGIKKSKVAVQFVTELLCVTLIAITVGAGVGSVVSVPVANDLLSAQVEQIQSEAANQEQNFGRPGIGGRPGMSSGGMAMYVSGAENQAEVTYLEQINATVNFSVLLHLIAIGVVLTLISSLAAVVFVMRYEPLKILAERA